MNLVSGPIRSLCVGLLLCGAAPAFAAAEGEQPKALTCAIAQFPAEAARQLLSVYERGGMEAVADHEIADAAWDKVLPCLDDSGPDAEARAESFGAAIVSYQVMKAAEASLEKRYAIRPQALEQAWKSLSAEERGALAGFGTEGADEDALIMPTIKLLLAARPTTTEAELGNAQLGQDAVAYAMMRAKLESLAGRY